MELKGIPGREDNKKNKGTEIPMQQGSTGAVEGAQGRAGSDRPPENSS
jgi:hypothetical protein